MTAIEKRMEELGVYQDIIEQAQYVLKGYDAEAQNCAERYDSSEDEYWLQFIEANQRKSAIASKIIETLEKLALK